MTYFDSIIGQDSIKAHLSKLVSSNALPHSLLFYGEAGLGKLDMAIGLAALLLGRQVFSQPKGESYLADVKEADRKSTRLNSSHIQKSRMPSSA